MVTTLAWWIIRFNKTSCFQNFSWFQFYVQVMHDNAWLCALALLHRLLNCFCTKMISVNSFHFGKCVSRRRAANTIDAKNSNFEIFENVFYEIWECTFNFFFCESFFFKILIMKLNNVLWLIKHTNTKHMLKYVVFLTVFALIFIQKFKNAFIFGKKIIVPSLVINF